MKLKFFICVSIIFIFVPSCVQKKGEWRGTVESKDGVEIVKNQRKPMYSGDVLLLKEELNLDERSLGQVPFYKIREIDLDNEQNIYVLDWMAGWILVYDQNGKHLRTIGRKGQGPGEFGRPIDISIFGDKLMVHDLERCLSFFTLNGKYIKSVTSKDVLGFWDVQCDSVGNIIAQTSHFDFRNPDYLKNPKHLFIKYDHDMNMLFQFAESPRPSYIGPSNPFAAIAMIAVDRKDFIIFGYPDDYRIDIFSPNGKLIKKIEKEYLPVELSWQDKKEMREDNSELQHIEYPKYKPPFRRFFIDDEGRIYVGTWQKSNQKGSYYYDIFDPEGRYLAQVSLKEKPIICRNSKLYSIETNDEDYQCVKRYKMIWR